MATTQGTIGYGTSLYVGDGASPEVYTEILEPYDISEIGQESSLVDMTHHDSPNRTKEYLKGLREGTVVTISCNRVDNDPGQDAMIGYEADNVTHNFRAEIPNAAAGIEYLYFSGLVMKYGYTTPIEDRLGITFDIKVTGNILRS